MNLLLTLTDAVSGWLYSNFLFWVLNLADIFMGCMAIVNIIAILCLGEIAFKALADYTKQKKDGKDPVFKAKDIGLDNTDCWK